MEKLIAIRRFATMQVRLSCAPLHPENRIGVNAAFQHCVLGVSAFDDMRRRVGKRNIRALKVRRGSDAFVKTPARRCRVSQDRELGRF